MKAKFLLFVLLALSISKAKANETEPNNIKAQASTLALNTIDIGKIEYAGDVDWWKVTTNADGKLRITISALNNNDIGVSLYVFDKDGKTQLGQTGSASLPGITNMDGLAAGTYYIKIICSYPTDTTFYSLTDSLIPASPANDAEPNGLVTQAKMLLLNGSKTGHIGYYYSNKRDTADWYKVTTTANGQLDVNLTVDYGSDYGTGNHGIGAWLVDGDKTTIISSGGGNPSGTFKTDGLAPGTYYIKVFSTYSDEFSTYTISNTLEKTTYKDVEPNDYETQADSLPVNKTKKGNIGYRYNSSIDYSDWYKITTSASGLLKVTATPINGQYIYMYLYNGDSSHEITEGYSYSSLTLNADNLPAGVYYVKVQPYYYVGYMNYTITDSLFKHSLNAVSSNETNQSDAVAKNIISVYPNPASSQLNIRLNNTMNNNQKIIIALSDMNGKPVWKKEVANSSSNINADVSKLPNGIYVLQIMNADKIITTQKISVTH